MRRNEQAQPLYQAHDAVYGGAHVVGCEAPDEGVEIGRSWTDSQQEGNLNEDEYQAGDAVYEVSRLLGNFRPCREEAWNLGQDAYRHIMLKMMTRLKWNMLAMPSAIHRRMQSTPVLHTYCQFECSKCRWYPLTERRSVAPDQHSCFAPLFAAKYVT